MDRLGTLGLFAVDDRLGIDRMDGDQGYIELSPEGQNGIDPEYLTVTFL